MTRHEITALMAQEAGITIKAADKALKAFLNAISNSVAVGNKVSFIGFGTFGLKNRNARTGINPKTGQTIEIEATKVPYFKPSDKLKERANQDNLT